MSHQTGIRSNEKLRNFFAKSKEGKIRYFKVVINDSEELELSSYKEIDDINDDYTVDFDKMLTVIEPKSPCYLFYRLDEKASTGYTWLFVTWSPDFAPIKQKMLYAATKSTLKLEFGAGQIKDELFGTARDDISLDGYMRHLKSQAAPPPLTNREEEIELIKAGENLTKIHIDTKHKTLQGVMFPIEQAAIDKIDQFKREKLAYLQFAIDISGETIRLDKHKDHLDIDGLREEIPVDKGRFHLFRFTHVHEKETFKSVLFIYSMPGFSCPVKERMLYSSCKSELINYIRTDASIDVSKTFEIGEPSEINEKDFINELHPKKLSDAMKFEKPKGPTSRGPRRVTRPESNGVNL